GAIAEAPERQLVPTPARHEPEPPSRCPSQRGAEERAGTPGVHEEVAARLVVVAPLEMVDDRRVRDHDLPPVLEHSQRDVVLLAVGRRTAMAAPLAYVHVVVVAAPGGTCSGSTPSTLDRPLTGPYTTPTAGS